MNTEVRVIELPQLFTRADFTPKSANVADRTIELIFSTGAPVERFDGYGTRYVEILSLDPKHVRTDRLNSGGPLLNAHRMTSVRDQIGVVVAGTVRVVPTAARATVRFSRRADVEPIWQDVQAGIISGVSVGYRVFTYKEAEPKPGALPVRTAIDWEPVEVSMVPIPADAGAKTRSHHVEALTPCVISPVRVVVPRALAGFGVGDGPRRSRMW